MADGARPAGFVPGRHPLEAYGSGGFRFAGMSHRGSLLALPSGLRAWEVGAPGAITLASLAPAVEEAAAVGLLLIGTGADPAPLPPALLAGLRAAGLRADAMPTAAAARTYNVLVAEGRRVGAALIAVP